MTRSAWKGQFVYSFLLSKKFLNRKRKIKIWTRNSAIPSALIGRKVHIHNGKNFFKIRITRQKVGYKFGQFAFTRSLAPKKDPRIKVKTKKPIKKPVKATGKKK